MPCKTMNDHEVAEYWESNAEAWTALSRKGYDVYRDALNTPAFLSFLPDVSGLVGLDIGCGEGHNTRLIASRGASMVAVDVSETLVRHAREEEERTQMGIEYHVSSANALPFAAATFDFAVATMSLMDVCDIEGALSEVHRVLRAGAFFQFSITHPCFVPDYREALRDERGHPVAVAVAGYFDSVQGAIEEWTFHSAPKTELERLPPFRVPRFNRTLSEWISLPARQGFVIEAAQEPRPDEETVRRYPSLDHVRIVPQFLHMRLRK